MVMGEHKTERPLLIGKFLELLLKRLLPKIDL